MARAIIFSLLLMILSACSDKKEEAVASNPAQETVEAITPKQETQVNTAPQGIDDAIFNPQDMDIVLGDKDSKVTMVEYSSLTCPHCSYYHRDIFPELRKKYIDTNKIRYIFREFVSNKQDLDGAIMGRCMKDQNDPLRLFDVLYSQQDHWAYNKNYREILENIGKLAGISAERYNECLGQKELLEFLVNNSRAISFYKGFPGTPSFFINGKPHKGFYTIESLSKDIDDAIMESTKAEEENGKQETTNPDKKTK